MARFRGDLRTLGMESMLLCIGVERFAGDEEAVDKITGRVARAHGLERSQICYKILSFFCSQGPKGFVSNHIQTEVPAFCTLT